MAAFLTVDVLRAHAAPDFPRALFGHAPARPFAAPPPGAALTARRRVAPDGRPTCRRRTDVSAPFGPPPN